mmetsp:Transcript_25096/g.37089  ORF Transcript_25096/g.37089 Transcript_25096/m.37089 type:complete len:212 (-) Transcript_25096:85-720(-)
MLTVPTMFRYMFLVCVLLASATRVSAFFQKAAGAAKISPLTEEALMIYEQKYSFDKQQSKNVSLGQFGMPMKVEYKEDSKRLTDISKQNAKVCFNELVKLYGDERALDMVKFLPICLSFNKDNFGPQLDKFSDKFGLEESKDMVRRNPGLLAVKPTDAEKSDDSTMVFSYIIGYTRPISSVGLPLLLLLLLTPAIESVTGVPIRSTLFGGL